MSHERSRRRRAGQGKAKAISVGTLVEATLAKLGIAERVERAGAVANWPELVGERIAQVARPAGISHSTLFVEVDSASWRMELNMLRPELLAKLNAGRDGASIEKIVFVQSDVRNRAGDKLDGEEKGR